MITILLILSIILNIYFIYRQLNPVQEIGYLGGIKGGKSRPIKGTPILRGKDAVRFHEQMEKNENPTPEEREARIKERERIMKAYNQFKKIKDKNNQL